MLEIIAQAVGIAAMTFNIISYLQKTSERAIGCQLFGGILFSLNYFMLGAVMGGILNCLGALRCILFLNRKKFKADHIGWLIGFIISYIICYVLVFTVFKKEFTLFNAIIELLPVIGMTALSVSFRLQDAKAIRRFGLISSPSWLIYNIVNFAIGAIVCEVLTLCSIIIGTLKHDIKYSKTKSI